ncbi:MAG: exodeoxyribonuclease VII small subunit [Gammaproteobacteria bacterium]|nr:exodeoxyribonuclease VII small subunit [Gammaproteobacteria bacterium]|tara:strand:- start:161 stop:373 length:213 start_codon:yes stop_codon:yes gene_type:complete
MNKKSKNPLSTFENDLQKMQTILEDIESNELNLEETIEKYKLGIELSKRCQKALEEAQQKIKIVSNEQKK